MKELVGQTLGKLNVPVEALYSTLGRTAARGLETRLIARWAKEMYAQLLDNLRKGDTRTHNAVLISGTAFVSVEREKVLRSWTTNVPAGAPAIQVPIEESDAP